jgi:2-hydroxyglutarate dehydrogenase
VIGGGVVGLSIARALARRNANTLLLERHPQPGQETSSRNSEVIHAGIYYGADTLKTQLCIRGKEMLYAYCEANGVPHRNTGKLIVAQTAAQRGELQKVYDHCAGPLGGRVPVRWVGGEELRRREPAVRAEAGCLESPTTGIVDSHGLMMALLGQFEDSGGIFSPGSHVVGVAPLPGPSGTAAGGQAGWEVTVRGDARPGDQEESTTTVVTTDTLVNAAGLGATDVLNMVVGPDRRMRTYYAKGNYFSYSSPLTPRPPTTLVYPAPTPGAAGLGTHLTLDLAGRIRFGPDVEWVGSDRDLAVSSGAERMAAAAREIKSYLPGVDPSALAPDYAGIRPKLAPRQAVLEGRGFNDFVIRREEGYEGWVNLLGIESPGLTSSLAIGEMVEGLLYR